MSQLVGPDGHTPISSKSIKYRAGGLEITVPLTPDTLLGRALSGARQVAGQQAYMEEHQKTGSEAAAQAAGQAAAVSVNDPFSMEPCALSVFMYLAREIEYRDRVIQDMAKRLDALDGKKTDLSHPYGKSEVTLEAAVGEAEGQADSSGKN